MVVQHNISAMNAERMLGINSKIRAKSTEKLSSGYKINRAADDASGLAVSEKMRRQIRGLRQAVQNAQDGISMVQIADGAMAEIQDMLLRGMVLSVQASNGTLSQSDRNAIQMEIDQLRKEIDGIAQRTLFNETGASGRDLSYPGSGGRKDRTCLWRPTACLGGYDEHRKPVRDIHKSGGLDGNLDRCIRHHTN